MKRFRLVAAASAFFVLSVVVGAQAPTIEQYLKIRSATSPTFSPDNSHIAYLSNASGTWQVWSLKLSSGKELQLTNYDDNISFVRWLYDGSGIIFGKAIGGNENTQLYWMKTDGSEVRALTNEPAVRHNFGELLSDGKVIAYASNKRDRNFFDIYGLDIATGKVEIQYQQDGDNRVVAINNTGTKFVVSRSTNDHSLDNNLYLIDSHSKSEVLLTPHREPAQYGNVKFIAHGIVYTHNEGREFASLAAMRQKNAAGDDWSPPNREITILDNADWDVSDIEMSPYGNLMAYTLNREGYSELYLRKYETGGKPLITTIEKTSEMVPLPGKGIVGGLTLSMDQSKLAFTFTSPTRMGDIMVYDVASKKLTQVTRSDTAGVAVNAFLEPKLIRYRSFDGRSIPAWYYEPPRERNFLVNMAAGVTAKKVAVPVIVSVHGGPEGQERPGFDPLYQNLISRGYAILATNVRGSTGYGKTFTHLDDVKKREDSVKDLAYAAAWLKTSGNADPNRIAIMGGSYGGYMTLAAITLYPDLWAAAVNTVGIANWESFLKNTSGYRRRQREAEYGRLDRDLSFLQSISPLAKVDRIKCPLFVIHGKNDPRVPYTEAEQIVEAIRKRGGVVQYKLYDDEGHGISKLKNRLELYPMVTEFLDAHLKK